MCHVVAARVRVMNLLEQQKIPQIMEHFAISELFSSDNLISETA
jgi:hypothetical protein